jgi:predicted regulator of Ras-like GTPase activity (Roadblock/LC7/MglB family)
VRSDIDRLFSDLRKRAPAAQALVVFGPDGSVLSQASSDPYFSSEAFISEYAMFLRIARRTAEDTAMGDPEEYILVSHPGLILIRRLPEDHFAVLVASPEGQVGRLRYELKRSLLYSTFFHYELERT